MDASCVCVNYAARWQSACPCTNPPHHRVNHLFQHRISAFEFSQIMYVSAMRRVRAFSPLAAGSADTQKWIFFVRSFVRPSVCALSSYARRRSMQRAQIKRKSAVMGSLARCFCSWQLKWVTVERQKFCAPAAEGIQQPSERAVLIRSGWNILLCLRISSVSASVPRGFYSLDEEKRKHKYFKTASEMCKARQLLFGFEHE